MKEQLVSFDIVKLAKEKGIDFRDKKFGGYTNTGKAGVYHAYITQSLLQKWLREVHTVDVVAIPVRFTGYIEVGYWTYSVQGEQPVGKQQYKFDTYEKALEMGLVIGLRKLNVGFNIKK